MPLGWENSPRGRNTRPGRVCRGQLFAVLGCDWGAPQGGCWVSRAWDPSLGRLGLVLWGFLMAVSRPGGWQLPGSMEGGAGEPERRRAWPRAPEQRSCLALAPPLAVELRARDSGSWSVEWRPKRRLPPRVTGGLDKLWQVHTPRMAGPGRCPEGLRLCVTKGHREPSLRKAVVGGALIFLGTQPTLLSDVSGPHGAILTTTSRSEFKCRCVSDICTRISPGGTEKGGVSGAARPTRPPPARSCHRGCLRRDLGTKVQGFPRWLWEDGSACPSPRTARQGVAGRGLGSGAGVWVLDSPWAARPVA